MRALTKWEEMLLRHSEQASIPLHGAYRQVRRLHMVRMQMVRDRGALHGEYRATQHARVSTLSTDLLPQSAGSIVATVGKTSAVSVCNGFCGYASIAMRDGHSEVCRDSLSTSFSSHPSHRTAARITISLTKVRRNRREHLDKTIHACANLDPEFNAHSASMISH